MANKPKTCMELNKQAWERFQRQLVISGRMYDRLISAGMLKPKKHKLGKWRKHDDNGPTK